jgi:hypothetical protein
MYLHTLPIHIGTFEQAQFVHAQPCAVGEGEQEAVLEGAWRFEQFLAFLFGQHRGQRLLLFEWRHAQGSGLVAKDAEPVAQTVHGLFEIPFRSSLVHTDAVEVGVDLIGGYLVGHDTKMQGQLRDVAAVVGGEALALLVDGGMFNKLAVGLPEPRHHIAGLLHQRAVITFLEAHNFLCLV